MEIQVANQVDLESSIEEEGEKWYTAFEVLMEIGVSAPEVPFRNPIEFLGGNELYLFPQYYDISFQMENNPSYCQKAEVKVSSKFGSFNNNVLKFNTNAMKVFQEFFEFFPNIVSRISSGVVDERNLSNGHSSMSQMDLENCGNKVTGIDLTEALHCLEWKNKMFPHLQNNKENVFQVYNQQFGTQNGGGFMNQFYVPSFNNIFQSSSSSSSSTFNKKFSLKNTFNRGFTKFTGVSPPPLSMVQNYYGEGRGRKGGRGGQRRGRRIFFGGFGGRRKKNNNKKNQQQTKTPQQQNKTKKKKNNNNNKANSSSSSSSSGKEDQYMLKLKLKTGKELTIDVRDVDGDVKIRGIVKNSPNHRKDATTANNDNNKNNNNKSKKKTSLKKLIELTRIKNLGQKVYISNEMMDNAITEDLKESVTRFLVKIHHLQKEEKGEVNNNNCEDKNVHDENNEKKNKKKSKRKNPPKRVVFGLSECTQKLKFCRMTRVQVVVFATDIEKVSGKRGIVQRIDEIKRLAKENNVPVIFALTRGELGKTLGKKLQVSVCCVMNIQKSEKEFNKLMDVFEQTKKKKKESDHPDDDLDEKRE